jgi:hypothetical protein
VVQDGDIIFFKFNVSGGGKKWKRRAFDSALHLTLDSYIFEATSQ